MGRADECALFFCPAQRVEPERRPVLTRVATGIHLVFELQQAEVSALVRTKTTYLDIVAQDIGKRGDLVVGSGEKLFLIIEARAPGEIRTDLQILAEAMPHHVRRVYALGGIGVVRAARRVNVVVAGHPARERGIDPALDLEVPLLAWRVCDGERRGLFHGFGAALKLHDVGACGESEILAVGAIDLRMKGEVGRESLGLRRVNALLLIANDKPRGGGPIVFIAHAQRDRVGGCATKQEVGLIAKTDVLSALADVERKLRLPLAGVAAVELDDPIFEFESAERGAERLCVEHLQLQPARGHIGSGRIEKALRMRTRRVQHRGGAGLVLHFHEK